MSALISSWVMFFTPQRLPTLTISALRRGEVEDGVRHKVVVQDDVRRLDETQGLHREQIGIAGAGADQPHFVA